MMRWPVLASIQSLGAAGRGASWAAPCLAPAPRPAKTTSSRHAPWAVSRRGFQARRTPRATAHGVCLLQMGRRAKSIVMRGPKEEEPSVRGRTAEAVQRGRSPQEKMRAGNGDGRQSERAVERIAGERLEFGAGREDDRVGVFAGDVELAISQ